MSSAYENAHPLLSVRGATLYAQKGQAEHSHVHIMRGVVGCYEALPAATDLL